MERVLLPPSLVGAPGSKIEVFLFCYEHEGESLTAETIAKAISRDRPHTSSTLKSFCDAGLLYREGRATYLGDALPEETFWVSVPEPLVGMALPWIQMYNWIARCASNGVPVQLKLKDLAEQFNFTRQSASRYLSKLQSLGLIEYEGRPGTGQDSGITLLRVG